MELSLLCECEIALAIIYEDKSSTIYCSSGDINATMEKLRSLPLRNRSVSCSDDVSLLVYFHIYIECVPLCFEMSLQKTQQKN